MSRAVWTEYDSCAAYHAKHDRLPQLVSDSAMRRINFDTDAFYERVRAFKYAQAMERVSCS